MKATDPTLSPARSSPQHAGRVIVAAVVLIFVAWLLVPLIPQDQSYHGFADRRAWLGVPNAADVLTNVAFALVGIVGVARLVSHRRARFDAATEAGLWLIALGILGTAAGSAWYHLDPTDATLVWDRLPMTIVFAGVLGTAIAQRLGEAIGRWTLTVLPLFGMASVAYWRSTGDLSLYALLQLGGIATLAALIAFARHRDDPFPWGWVVACYVAAKLAEAGEYAVWNATSGLVAGHALKHLLAAAAVAAALLPLVRRR